MNGKIIIKGVLKGNGYGLRSCGAAMLSGRYLYYSFERIILALITCSKKKRPFLCGWRLFENYAIQTRSTVFSAPKQETPPDTINISVTHFRKLYLNIINIFKDKVFSKLKFFIQSLPCILRVFSISCHLNYSSLRASVAISMRSSQFWDVMQRRICN